MNTQKNDDDPLETLRKDISLALVALADAQEQLLFLSDVKEQKRRRRFAGKSTIIDLAERRRLATSENTGAALH